MDIKTVNKLLRSELKPLLLQEGFVSSASKKFWRYHEDRIDVVSLQHPNSHGAAVLGCTTYSFFVNIGCYLLDVPYVYDDMKEGSKGLRPGEEHCHFRRRLERGIEQDENFQAQLWSIVADEHRAKDSIKDACDVIERTAIPWFSRFENKEETLRILIEEEPTFENGLCASKDSCVRNSLIGYIASAMGDAVLARKHLEAALDTGFTSDRDAERMHLELNKLASREPDTPHQRGSAAGASAPRR